MVKKTYSTQVSLESGIPEISDVEVLGNHLIDDGERIPLALHQGGDSVWMSRAAALELAQFIADETNQTITPAGFREGVLQHV